MYILPLLYHNRKCSLVLLMKPRCASCCVCELYRCCVKK